MPTPTVGEVQFLGIQAYNWVAARVRPTPDGASNQYAVSMYPAIPLTLKVPPGYNVPGADHGDCDYIYQCGNQNQNGSPQMTLINLKLDEYESITYISVGPWADGQPNLAFQLNYKTDSSNPQWADIDLYWYGKPSSDSRGYPIAAYWRDQQLFADHRTKPSGWIYSTFDNGASAPGLLLNGNKYFLRTEDLVAMRLLQGSMSTQLRTWNLRQWPSTGIDMDVHAPLFKDGSSLSDDFMFAWPSFTYHDCTVTHNGCANGWIKDDRAAGTGWGFSHRSKVCTWPTLYVTVLRQDALGLLSQAIHILNKYNNPWHSYANPWPSYIPGGPSGSTVTPIGIANFVWNKWYRSGVGVTMFQVPVIGHDQRASSLRTNQMGILATLLGYRYSISGWTSKADTIAGILRETAVGMYGQPSFGCYSAGGSRIRRPKYRGAQLFVWDVVNSFGVTSFSWLRQTINDLFGLPEDDSDYILSTVETTATFAQFWRVYGWHKYSWLFGPSSTIPGY